MDMAGASINKVFLLGNIGRDPELRVTGNGKSVATFTLATSERGKAEGGEQRTEWHRIVVWDRLAEQCNQFLSKGRQVHVEGRLQTRQWEDRNGQRRQTTEIVAHQVQFLGSQRGEGGGGGGYRPPAHGDDDYSGGQGGGPQGDGPQGDGPQGGGPQGGGGGGYPNSGGYQQSGGYADAGPSQPQQPAAKPEPDVPYEDDEDIPF
jgi:single-strand DNA-binding protein